MYVYNQVLALNFAEFSFAEEFRYFQIAVRKSARQYELCKNMQKNRESHLSRLRGHLFV